MNKLILPAVYLLLSACLFAQQNTPFQTDQVIVRFRSDAVLNDLSKSKILTGTQEFDRVITSYGAQFIRKLNTGKNSEYQAVVIKFNNGTDINAVLEKLAKIATVEYAEPDFIGKGSGVRGTSPNDQYYNRQWGLKNDGSFSLSAAIAGADIEMEEGWALEKGDSSVIVGIIDSGCKLDHPDLQGRIWKNYDEIPGNGIDEGNNGFIDDIQSWDFAYSDNNPADDYGHGSNVAGIIGAKGNNGTGYAGVDWNCKLMILKGLNSQNRGYYSWWSDAIHYAVDNGAKVLNMSLGGTDVSATLNDAVNYALNKKVTVVACMMNSNSNTVFYPAAYPGVIAVGSTNPDDKRSHPFFWSNTSGSNYGSHISVVAPGNYIYGLDYQSNTNYGSYWGGTSQATPLVSGLAALLLAQNPALTPAQIKNIIQKTAEDQVGDPTEDTPGWDQYFGNGRINAHSALLSVSGIIDNTTNDQLFTLFPNPTNGILHIVLSGNLAGKESVRISNHLGQEIYRAELKNQTTSISVPLTPGVYIVKVNQGLSESVKKLIIR